ncbi:endonuclease domain-containing protein [Novosphingobium sp. 9]|uniref:endonuclease domain-containing protein n=1 Tax=Novosphingobium sp. 9 TaxID=2025349 RepID=UPI0021B6D849|nr:endonuclease domain-containing protein [Novosphingobium sp. 9]
MRDASLTRYARAMRHEMTEPEIRMWLQLRAERFEGVKFRRQKVIGPFIADFSANEPRLVIEIDGHTHDIDDPRDKERTQYLVERGYHVIRFTNLDVMTNMDGVLIKLSQALETAREAPLPTLSPEGERAK